MLSMTPETPERAGPEENTRYHVSQSCDLFIANFERHTPWVPFHFGGGWAGGRTGRSQGRAYSRLQCV